MLGFPVETKFGAKCIVSHGVMNQLDPKQPPMKKKPYSAILNQNFVQRIELIMPEELYPTIEKCILSRDYAFNYSRVILPLKALLEEDFFNEYIKKGNILMLSEGQIGAGNVYFLKEGKLRLHLDRKSYESAGLVGKPDGTMASQGIKKRWMVEIDFRQPSMLHGKKGFNRIIYAFEKVLVHPVTWLLCNLNLTTPTPDPLDKHFPVKKTATPIITRNKIVNKPSLQPPPETNLEFDYFAMETHEWLSLIMLDSPRVCTNDVIDPVLSRYCPPGETTESKLAKIVWRGFISPSSAHKLFKDILLATPREFWFTINISGFPLEFLRECKDCMILRVANTSMEFVLWETC